MLSTTMARPQNQSPAACTTKMPSSSCKRPKVAIPENKISRTTTFPRSSNKKNSGHSISQRSHRNHRTFRGDCCWSICSALQKGSPFDSLSKTCWPRMSSQIGLPAGKIEFIDITQVDQRLGYGLLREMGKKR